MFVPASHFPTFHRLRIFSHYHAYSEGRNSGGGGPIKTVVYLDVLLLTNFLTAHFLLLAAGALSGQRAGFGHMLAGSGLAALSALILFAPEQPYPVQVGYKIATAFAITAAAFGVRSKRRLVTAACWYAALNILLAGVVLLVILATNTRMLDTANLTVYLHISPLLLLALSGACCAAVELALRLLPRRETPVKTAGLEFELCGVPIRLRAALDTGCHLQDPITCLPVLVVSYPDAKARLPAAVCSYLDAWFAGATQADPPPGVRLRLVPCGTAAEKRLLPGFAVQGISLITEKGVLGLGRSAVVFAPRSFGSTAYEALYGSDFM